MSARQKINIACFNGAVIVAALVGGMVASWPVFWGVLAVLAAGAVYGRDIRPFGGRPSGRR